MTIMIIMIMITMLIIITLRVIIKANIMLNIPLTSSASTSSLLDRFLTTLSKHSCWWLMQQGCLIFGLPDHRFLFSVGRTISRMPGGKCTTMQNHMFLNIHRIDKLLTFIFLKTYMWDLLELVSGIWVLVRVKSDCGAKYIFFPFNFVGLHLNHIRIMWFCETFVWFSMSKFPVCFLQY